MWVQLLPRPHVVVSKPGEEGASRVAAHVRTCCRGIYPYICTCTLQRAPNSNLVIAAAARSRVEAICSGAAFLRQESARCRAARKSPCACRDDWSVAGPNRGSVQKLRKFFIPRFQNMFAGHGLWLISFNPPDWTLHMLSSSVTWMNLSWSIGSAQACHDHRYSGQIIEFSVFLDRLRKVGSNALSNIASIGKLMIITCGEWPTSYQLTFRRAVTIVRFDERHRH